MNVKLISHTPDALSLLLRTKNTRLAFDSDPATWSEEKRAEHLAYMRDTIKSSWEFVDYTFEINNVTRAFTHQLVRTRTGSYAQESQRTVDVSDHDALNPFGDYLPQHNVFEHAVADSLDAYAQLIEMGAKPGDARGILPTNILTSIVAKFDLRTLHEMAKVRLCTRTQGEYQQVFRAMKAAVVAVHPWADEFINVHCVATGTCAFPRYGKKDCPVYHPIMDRTEAKAIAKLWWNTHGNYEANPIAKEGKAS
jgi:flavin-dependent thymidylate synthase